MGLDFAPACAFRRQRYTLEVEIFRSSATSDTFLPLLSSDITLEQSTFAACAITGFSAVPSMIAKATLAIAGTIFLTAAAPPFCSYEIQIIAENSRTRASVKTYAQGLTTNIHAFHELRNSGSGRPRTVSSRASSGP